MGRRKWSLALGGFVTVAAASYVYLSRPGLGAVCPPPAPFAGPTRSELVALLKRGTKEVLLGSGSPEAVVTEEADGTSLHFLRAEENEDDPCTPRYTKGGLILRKASTSDFIASLAALLWPYGPLGKPLRLSDTTPINARWIHRNHFVLELGRPGDPEGTYRNVKPEVTDGEVRPWTISPHSARLEIHMNPMSDCTVVTVIVDAQGRNQRWLVIKACTYDHGRGPGPLWLNVEDN